MAGKLEREFDSIEIAALEAWLNERSPAQKPGSAERGKPKTTWHRGYMDRLRAEEAAVANTKAAANKFKSFLTRAYREMPGSTAVSDIAAGIKIARNSLPGKAAAQIGGAAASAAGVNVLSPVAGVASLFAGGPTAAAIAIAALTVAKAIDVRLSRAEGSMDALAGARGRSHKALKNPIWERAMGREGNFRDTPWSSMAIFAKDSIWAVLSSQWAMLTSIMEGNRVGYSPDTGQRTGIPLDMAAQAFFAVQKSEPEVIRSWNNVERQRFDQQINRGEMEFLGWRKTPERFGG